MLARGPNLLNLATYAQGQGQQPHYDPNQMAQLVQNEQITVQQQFDTYIKNINKYDEILQKVAQSINNVSSEQHFITDFYPAFAVDCTYEDDQEKKIIMPHDVELGRIVENLERGNRKLKEEWKGWLFQYAKKTRLSEVLLTENKLLRKFTSQKNKDIIKLIKTITNAQNEELNQLNETLNELKEENGVLLDHLKEIKAGLAEKADEEKKVVEAYQKAERQKLEIEAKIKAGEDEEEHYAKMVTLLETSLEDARQREKRLLQQRQRLLQIKKQFEQDSQQIETQINQCQIDRQQIDDKLKTKFNTHQTEKQKLMDQIEEITDKIKRIKEEQKTIIEDITRNQFKIQQYIKINTKLDKDIVEIGEKIKGSQQELQKNKEVQVANLSTIDMIDFDISVLKEEISRCEASEQEAKERYKKEIKILQDENRKEVQKMYEELRKVQMKTNQTLMQKKGDIGLKKKQIQALESMINDKKGQIQELKKQLLEVKENQATYTNLREKLRELEKK